MRVHVIVFGQIAEITGNTNFVMDDVTDTDQLVSKLHALYPQLTNSKYAIAVNKKIIRDNMQLDHDVEVAIMPPFSGG